MIQSTVSTPCYSTHTARTVADPTLSETLQGDILIRIQKERNIHCGAKHWSMEDVGGTAQAGIIYLPPTRPGNIESVHYKASEHCCQLCHLLCPQQPKSLLSQIFHLAPFASPFLRQNAMFGYCLYPRGSCVRSLGPSIVMWEVIEN
jgi:hypothetical protein